MTRFWKNEKGVSLFELIVTIILVGSALPFLLGIIGQMASFHLKDEIAFQAVSLANSKMEEIMAFKKGHANWYGSISSFAGSESLSDGFVRTVTLTTINDWISPGIDACRVDVQISHPQLPQGFVITTIFII
ncbi:MAG: hypothetical protein Kow0042_14600 [Calditrichia bacterium]